jgi:hypothetical protein
LRGAIKAAHHVSPVCNFSKPESLTAIVASAGIAEITESSCHTRFRGFERNAHNGFSSLQAIPDFGEVMALWSASMPCWCFTPVCEHLVHVSNFEQTLQYPT